MPPPARPVDGILGPGPGWLGRTVIVVFGMNVVLAWMAIQASLVLVHAVWLAAAGKMLEGAEPGRIAGQIAGLRLAQAALWVGAAGLLLVWIHRAHRTLEALGVDGVRSARDAVRDCLVPGVNVVRIPRLVAELWRASAVEAPSPAVSSLVGWWWTSCMATLVLDLDAIPPVRSVLSGVGLAGGLPILVLGECLRIGAAVLTIVIVGRIERHQRERLAMGTPVGG